MRSYHHFTLKERIYIEYGLLQELSYAEIARQLGVHPSSVGREVRRNQNKQPGVNGITYNAATATNRYKNRRRKKSVRKYRLKQDAKLCQFVCKKLERTWTPEEIVNTWKEMNPGEKLSPSTIYRAIKRGDLPQISAKEHLRRHGKHKHGERSKYNSIHPEHTIHERPESVEKRARLGDWEGDTVAGGVGKGYILTLVDRHVRMLLAKKVMTLNAKEVAKAAVGALKESGLPVNTITLDNGAEFAEFKRMEEELKATVYFADPHSPWQRATNESYNDRLRFFFPKGTDLREVPDSKIAYAADLINERPRKCLGNRSAYEATRIALSREQVQGERRKNEDTQRQGTLVYFEGRLWGNQSP